MARSHKQKTFRQIRARWLKNRSFKKAYDSLGPEFSLISALAQYRRDRGLTQKELADKVGTHQSAIARFESGSYNPSLAFAQKLASALGAKISVTQ